MRMEYETRSQQSEISSQHDPLHWRGGQLVRHSSKSDGGRPGWEMSINITAAPLPTAVEHLSRKAIIPSILRSADWAKFPAQLRDRSEFSSGVEDMRFLQTVQDKLLNVVKMQREQVKYGEAFVNRDSFIADLRQVAREQGIGTGAGDLTDVQSYARLGLIYDMQISQAQNFARWKMDQDQDILNAFPAQELLRVEDRVNKRDWQSRWRAAGGNFYAGRMIALKNAEIWVNISAFGTPWPPFDWGSGMGVRDVSRRSAVDLGLIKPDEQVVPDDMGFNDNLEVDISTLAPAFVEQLSNLFGTLVKISEGKLKWLGS